MSEKSRLRGPYNVWSESNMQAAIDEVKSGNITVRSAAQAHYVPRSTLNDAITAGRALKRERDSDPVTAEWYAGDISVISEDVSTTEDMADHPPPKLLRHGGPATVEASSSPYIVTLSNVSDDVSEPLIQTSVEFVPQGVQEEYTPTTTSVVTMSSTTTSTITTSCVTSPTMTFSNAHPVSMHENKHMPSVKPSIANVASQSHPEVVVLMTPTLKSASKTRDTDAGEEKSSNPGEVKCIVFPPSMKDHLSTIAPSIKSHGPSKPQRATKFPYKEPNAEPDILWVTVDDPTTADVNLSDIISAYMDHKKGISDTEGGSSASGHDYAGREGEDEGSLIFAEVESLLKPPSFKARTRYQVRVDELKRRCSSPENLSPNILVSYLRINKNRKDELKTNLTDAGVNISGRAKPMTTHLSRITEGEMADFAQDVKSLFTQYFPVEKVANKIAETFCDPCQGLVQVSQSRMFLNQVKGLSSKNCDMLDLVTHGLARPQIELLIDTTVQCLDCVEEIFRKNLTGNKAEPRIAMVNLCK